MNNQGCIAVLNAGSSSIKFALYDPGNESLVFRGQVESIGLDPHLKVRDLDGKTIAEQRWPAAGFDHAAATEQILQTTRSLLGERRVVAVGHRVVHGGMRFAAPTLIDDGVMLELEALVPLAPLHQPHNLAPIRALATRTPHLRQIACFDTAFHANQAPVVRSYALPRSLQEEGVQRYGFHGLSYEYVTAELRRVAPEIANARVIIAHLGNGASLCGVYQGKSIVSTMGFTAVDGLMMGTRCGAIDPGVLVYLMDRHGLDARGIEDLIYRRSGLLGVSGISPDMRTLRTSSAPQAAEAIALFVHRIIREIGSLVAALGGLDGLVFTAGIGENDAATRAEVAAGCAWLGLTLDLVRNAAGMGRISTDGSRLSAWVVPTDEERMIVRHTIEMLGVR
jgi:acetate kinase